MDIDLLNSMCKEDTRNAFNEFKRVIDIELFTFNTDVKQDLQEQLIQGLCSRTTKHFINNYNLSSAQIKYLSNVTSQYKKLALEVSNNYSKRFL